MNLQHLHSFRDTLQTLQSKSSTQPSEEDFWNCCLCLVTGSTKVPTGRFGKLKDIISGKLPLLLCTKSNQFWQPVETSRLDSDVSFVSVRKRNKGKSTFSSSSSEKSVGNLGGSPLKLDIIADLSVFDGDVSVPAYASRHKRIDCGLPLGKARQILSLYANMFSSIDKKPPVGDKHVEDPTLVIPCNGQNIKSVSCICLEPLVDKQNNFLGVKATEVVSKPSADKGIHMKLQTNFSASVISCHSKYDLITAGADKVNADNMIKLELEWKKAVSKSVVLLHAPPSDAKSVVKIHVSSGNTNSPAFGMYQELEILRSVISGLATMEVNWIGALDTPLVDAVKDLTEQLKLGSDTVEYLKGDTSGEDELQAGFHSVLLEERKDLDFTDHLWKIFQNCTSYSELVEALSYIVSVLRRGELQPLIHRHNNTALAQMVRDSFQGQLRTPTLTGLQPLLYLAEIGMQKLTQDYIHTFMSKNLTTRPQLEYFVSSHNLDLEDRLARLEKLQNVLETVIMLKQYLNVPQGTLADSTRHMLKHYETHGVDSSHNFVFPVPTSSLMNVLESYSPCEWRAEGSRIVGGIPERLAYHFTTEQPFDWVSIDGAKVERGSTGDTEEVAYYLTQLKDSVSILT